MNLNKIPENLKQILVSIAKEKDAEMSKIKRDSEFPDRLTEIFEMWKIETLSIKKNSGHYNPHRPCSPINTAGLDSIHKKGLINKKEYEPLIKEYHKLWSCLYDKKKAADRIVYDLEKTYVQPKELHSLAECFRVLEDEKL